MLITLFAFEIILIVLTMLTTHMVEHKFASIQASLGMYCSKRTYKTKADINFIEMMIAEYNHLCSDTDEEPDLPSAISLKLHKEYIGRFSYVSVMNIANKAKYLMWGIFISEIFIAWINQVTNQGRALVIIFASLLLTVIMCFYGIIKGLNEKQETLIDEVTHYIKNVYPIEVKKQKKQEEAKNTHSNLTKLDEVIKQSAQLHGELQKPVKDLVKEKIALKQVDERESKKITSDEQIKDKSLELSAKDIAQLLRNL